jgi:hypothetical protein
MAIQIATSGSLEDAQRIIISEVKYTAEHNAPCKNLVEHFTLPKGAKSITVPKVGRATAAALTDGVDMADSAAIGMASTSLTTSEVGLKFIVSDKLVRQEVPDVFRMVGRQGGDAMARKVDTDIIALFDGFSEASGSTGTNVTMAFFAAAVTRLEAGYAGTGEPAPMPYACVLHPHNIHALRTAVAVAGTYPIPHGYSEDLLKEWHELTLSGVPIFRDGNISINSTSTCTKGGMFSKNALCYVESQAPNIERERDASLRATEINFVADYGVFELDDAYGIEMHYYAPTPNIGP